MNDTTTNTAAAANPAAAPTHESFLQKLEGEALQGYIHGLTIARDGIEHTSSKVINTLTNWIGDAEAKLQPAAAGTVAAGKSPAAPAGGGASSSASTPSKLMQDDIEGKIVAEKYVYPDDVGPAQPKTVTVCTLTLQNGFKVIGVSACADPANFDKDLGMSLARADAVNKVWPLEGYLLKEQLFQQEQAQDQQKAAA